GHAPWLRRARRQAGRARWRAAAVVPLFPDAMESVSDNNWPQAILSTHSPRGRHGVGPCLSAGMRLGAGLLLSHSARGDRRGRPVRSALLSLLRGDRPLPRGAKEWLERGVLPVHADRACRGRKRGERRTADQRRPADFGTAGRERAVVLSQASWPD